MKKIFILLTLLINMQVINEAAVKNTQVNVKKAEETKNIESELEKADTYNDNNQLLKAKKIYEKYSSSSDKAKLGLANYYSQDLQESEAEKLFVELAKNKNKEALKSLGTMYLFNDEEDKLIKLFDPKNPKEMFELAEIYYDNYETTKASNIYRELAEKGNKEAYLKLVSTYNYEVQADLLKLEYSKGNMEAAKLLGELYSDSGLDYETGVKYYKKYLEKHAGNKEIFTVFGEYYSKEDLKKEMAPYIKRGDKGAKETLELYLAKVEEGNALDDEVNVSENVVGITPVTENIGTETEEIKPNFEDLKTERVMTSFELNEKEYLDRIAEDNENYELKLELLYLYFRSNKKEKLDSLLDTMVKDGYYLDGNWKLAGDRAAEIYEGYVSEGINRAKKELAEIYVSKKQNEKAISMYENLVAQGNTYYIYVLADLYNKTGKYAKTIELKDEYGMDLPDETENFYLDEFQNYLLMLSAYADYKLGNLDIAEKEFKYLTDINYKVSSYTGVADTFYYPSKIYLLDIYDQKGDKEAFDKLEKTINPEYPSLMNSVNEFEEKKALADYYASKGKFKKAEELLSENKLENFFMRFINTWPTVTGLLVNSDFSGDNQKLVDIALKYKNYGEIKNTIDKSLYLIDNSYENSKYYMDSVKIAVLFTLKQYSEDLDLSESIQKKFFKYNDEQLKNMFKKDYKNLHKNKKGVSFYPNSLNSNLFLSSLMNEWGIKKEITTEKEDSINQYTKKQMFKNGFVFFVDKYSKPFQEVMETVERENLGGKNLDNIADEINMKALAPQIERMMDEFNGKINFDKDYKEFYDLLPTMVIMDMQETLENEDRKYIVEKINKDYSKYLTSDKIEKVKKMKDTTKNLENISELAY